ncbi:MAG: lipoate--protein ligase family protein [Desulfobaccales bacterium]
MTTWRLLDSGAMSPSLNMAVDRAILVLHANGQAPPTLRFYRWQPSAVSLGYFQKRHNLDLDACRQYGIEVVRRPTGGKAVLHLGDLTYAVVAGTADGIPSAVTAAYRLISGGLLAGLHTMGIEARMGRETSKSSQTDICFLRCAIGAIVHQGKKLVGSAQTWHASTMLQHGSIILEPQEEMLLKLWGGSSAAGELQTAFKGRLTSIREILGYCIDLNKLKAALREGLARTLGVELREGELTWEEWSLARELINQEANHNSCPTRISPKSPSANSGSASPA